MSYFPNASIGVTGSVFPLYSTLVGGSDGTDLRALLTDSSGQLKVIGAFYQATQPVYGALTNNNAAPAATLLGVLPAIAETAYTTVTYTTGDMVLPVTDLHGALNIDIQAIGGTSPTTAGFLDIKGADGNVFVRQTTASNLNATVVGTLTNNNAAPAATNIGALTGLANASNPTFSEGDQTLLSVGLSGGLRVQGTKTNNSAAPTTEIGVVPAVANAAAPTWTEGNQVVLSTDLAGNLRVIGGGTAIAAAVPALAEYQGLIATTAYPTAATAGNLVGAMGDKAGRSVTVLNTVRDLVGTAIVSNNSTASGVSFIGAGAAGVFTDIITFVATNRSTTATVVTLTDGTASYTFALAANGGIVINFPTPLPATSTATAWTIGNSATVACDYMAVYAKNK